MKRLRASALCFEKGQWLVVRLRDPHSGRLYLLPPGGAIDAAETAAMAAEREALEETGYRVVVNPQTEHTVDYGFEWGGKYFQCRTHFFLATLQNPVAEEPTAEETFLEGCEWLSTDSLLENLEFHPELRKALSPWIQKVYLEWLKKN